MRPSPLKAARLGAYDFLERFCGVRWYGPSERMEELQALMEQAEERAGTETEKHRVALWRKALWEWMCQGREQYLVGH